MTSPEEHRAVTTETCDNGPNQNWQSVEVGGQGARTVVLSDYAAGTCLYGSPPSPFADAEELYSAPCTLDRFQLWIWNGDDTVSQFVNQATGRCLDSNHAGFAYTHACGGNFQDWRRGF